MKPSHALCFAAGICATLSAQSLSVEWFWAGVGLICVAIWSGVLDA